MMRIRRYSLLSTIVILSAFSAVAQAADSTETIEVFRQSPAVQPFFEDAYGYAVFPHIGKGGIGIGGAFGEGQVYVDEEITGTVKLIKATIGFQLGGQVFSEIIFFRDKRSYDEFTSGEFEFDATASAVAITAGAHATAGTSGVSAGASAGPKTGAQAKANYHKGMAIFTHTLGGMMYEATIGGQKFHFEPKWK